MEDKKEFSDAVKARYVRLTGAFAGIELSGITILTGNNGSGKSLIRKQLPFLFKEDMKLDDVKDTRGMIRSTSMDARTGSNPEMGALAGMMRDTEWVATSQNTFHAVSGVIKSLEDGKAKYAVIDEYEIGCSEETILAMARYISAELNRLVAEKKIMGAMIITHSRLGVRNILHDHFVNIEGLTEEEWLGREVVPTDLDELDKNELFSYIKHENQ